MPRNKRPRSKSRHLVTIRRAGGRVTYKWEPSTALRARGWTTIMLGDNLGAAVTMAEEINARLDAWRSGIQIDTDHIGDAAQMIRAPNAAHPAEHLHATFADLAARYRKQELFNPDARNNRGLPYAAKTRYIYDGQIKWLEAWAENGKTRLRDIDADMVQDLKAVLIANASPYIVNIRMRVLSILMAKAEKWKMIKKGSDPAKRMEVPAAPRRTKRVDIETVEFLIQHAAERGLHGMALYIELGFDTFQRPGDLRNITRMQWREMKALGGGDHASLCGPDGRVYGLRLRQQKTARWLSAPVNHDLRQKVEARFDAADAAGCEYLLFCDRTGQRWDEKEAQADFRNHLDSAIQSARTNGHDWLIDQLTGFQFRDLRGSGMCWLRANGATVLQIVSRSGHSIEEGTSIIEGYMPADEASAAAGYVTARNKRAAHKDKEERG